MSKNRFPDTDHDHKACVRQALRSAEDYCKAQGLRLTPIRRRVLELIWQSHPTGAYDLLELLTAEGHKPSPPTVYRALEFLLDNGLAHRVASRNAFVGCTSPGNTHAAQLYICENCGVTVEQADTTIEQRIRRNAKAIQFRVHRQTVEVTGICPACQQDADEP